MGGREQGRWVAVLATALLLGGCSGQDDATEAGAPSSSAGPPRPSGSIGRDVALDATDTTGATALIRAAYAGDVERARELTAAGGDVNAQDSTQQSAYLIATSEVGDDPRLLEVTLAAGADVNAKDSYNGTGLIRAAHRGYPQIVDRLIAAGIDLDHVNRLGWTALLEAVILGDGGPGHQAVVRSLVAAGADTSIEDPTGRTALQIARKRGQDEVVAILGG